MLNRRDFVKNSVAGSTLLTFGSTAPGFLASTAEAAVPGKEKILVVIELTGGNDGLNTVIPYGDAMYYAWRPSLAIPKGSVLKIDDHIGLHPSLLHVQQMLNEKRVAAVQGVGYPNPNRSHFESMDIWHSADPTRKTKNGWLGRSMNMLDMQEGHVPAFHISKQQLPLAMTGSGAGVPTLHPNKKFDIQLAGSPDSFKDKNAQTTERLQPEVDRENDKYKKRKKLIDELSALGEEESNEMFQFVRRTSVNTLASIDQLREILKKDFRKPQGHAIYENNKYVYKREGLYYELQLVAQMIKAGFGTRVYYLALDGFDTHSGQLKAHANLMQQLGVAIQQFDHSLQSSKNRDRVLLMTFSEFGRRVRENGSGTDHGAGSSMLVIGDAVKAGAVGKHPSLAKEKLVNGDLSYHTDFRQVYATILDKWLGCDSRRVLGGKFEHIDLFA